MSRRYTAYSFDNIQPPDWSLVGSNDWSMCGYVYIDNLTAAGGDLCFMAEYPGAPNSHQSYIGWGFQSGNPVLRFTCGNGTTRVLNRYHTITTDAWYHLALVYDASANTITAYVDGTQVEQQSITVSYTFGFVEIGDFTFGSNAVEVAQVKVWEGYALSQAELLDEIAYWTPQHGTSFVKAWWQFDNADQLSDSSGNGHTLVWDESGSFGEPQPGIQTVPGQLEPDSGTVIEVAGAMTLALPWVGTNTLVQGSAGALSMGVVWAGDARQIKDAAAATTLTVSWTGTPGQVQAAAGALTIGVVWAGDAEVAGVVDVEGDIDLSVTWESGSPVYIHGARGALSAALQMSGVVQFIHGGAGSLPLQITWTGAADHVLAPLPTGWVADAVEGGSYSEHSPWISDSQSTGLN